MWSSPENIRDEDYVGNAHGDIYSFAIICSEVVNMKPAWESDSLETPIPEDIVHLVKSGGRRPHRPVLDPVAQDLSPALVRPLIEGSIGLGDESLRIGT